MKNKFNIAMVLIISIATFIALSIGVVIPALFSTHLISFSFIMIAFAIYVAFAIWLIKFLIDKMLEQFEKMYKEWHQK